MIYRIFIDLLCCIIYHFNYESFSCFDIILWALNFNDIRSLSIIVKNNDGGCLLSGGRPNFGDFFPCQNTAEYETRPKILTCIRIKK